MIAEQASDWLPEHTLLWSGTSRHLEASMLRWSDKWLPSGRLWPDYDWDHHADIPGEAGKEITSGLHISCALEGRLTLASQLLARPISQREIRTKQDLAAVNFLIEEALDDLGATLCGISGGPTRVDDSPRYSLPLLIEQPEPVVWLSISRNRLIDLVRSQATPPRNRPAIDELANALTHQEIRIGGHLGTARLSLREVEKLQVGDVILLDSTLATPLDLTINGLPQVPRGATVQTDQHSLSLTLEREFA